MTEAEGFALNIAGGVGLGVILEYFGMSGEILTILTVMLLLDWLFGMANAYIQGNLQSKLMWSGLFKKGTRWCFPFIVIAVLKGAGFENVDFITTAILSIIIVAEGYSVIGHIYSINYKETLPEIDSLKLLLQWIGKLFKGKIDDTLPPKDLEEGKENENTK